MASKKQEKKAGAVLHIHKHPHRGDGIKDHRGNDRCSDCGLEWDHPVHQLEPLDPDVAATSHRIVGERE